MPRLANWDGSFKYVDTGINRWCATQTNGELAMAGPLLCNAVLYYSFGVWSLFIVSNFIVVWDGSGPSDPTSPVGVYSSIGATPETITIIASDTPRVVITAPESCPTAS